MGGDLEQEICDGQGYKICILGSSVGDALPGKGEHEK